MRAVSDAVRYLRTPAAIRERCGRVYAAARDGQLTHFRLIEDRLDAVADYVLATIRSNYPTLEVPYHSRWRHFDAGGVDRWSALADTLDDPAERGRVATELAITSVLLDAGAGPDWRYRDADGRDYARSEGLAVASLALYRAGVFSADAQRPLRADADALAGVDDTRLAAGFQAGAGNPLPGIGGRAALLRALGKVVAARAELFGDDARLGNMFDALIAAAGPRRVLPAAVLLGTVLDAFSPIWPSRLSLDGEPLGDVWPHPAAVAGTDRAGDGLVPFHKLSQWLSYSLVEPLQQAGLDVSSLDDLTGLPEYRNGGLFIDLGALVPRDPALLDVAHAAAAEPIVEWRALTVILLDRLAERVRARLELDAERFPLAKLLEGGTWSAGRRIARERRGDGRPPLTLNSDGTVF